MTQAERDMAHAKYLMFLVHNGYRDVETLPDGRWAATFRFVFTHAIIVGKMFDFSGYDDRWCYHTYDDAYTALRAWDGTGEPTGWHRHPASGRRVSDEGDEYNWK